MTFANPLAWLGLIPLWGGILFLYFLRIRHQTVKTTAAFLWPENRDSVRADAPFQRLQWSLLLALQLLLAFLAILMLARPQVAQSAVITESTIFVVDGSASMNATDVKPSRFDAAVNQLNQSIATKSRTSRIAIIESGTTTRIVSGLTADESALARASRTLKSTDAEVDLSEAMQLAAAIGKNQPGAKIILLSDGVFSDIADFKPGGIPTAFTPIGRGAGNAFFRAFAAGSSARGDALLISVDGTFSEKREFALNIEADGEPLTKLNVVLNPGKPWTTTLPLRREVSRLEGKLDVDDALKTDNVALALGPDRRAVRILLVSAGNVFLERALALDPRVKLDRTASLPESESGEGPSNYDLVVFDGVAERPVRAKFAVTFGKPMAGGGIEPSGTTKNSPWSSTKKGPLTEGTGWNDLYIESMTRLNLQPGAVAWVSSADGPLLAEAAPGPSRRLVVPFSLLDSDLPLQPTFPILLSNIVSWASATGSKSGEELGILKPGMSWVMPGWSRGTLFTPDGDQAQVTSETGTLRLSNLDRVGWYRLRDGNRNARVGMSLINSSESNLLPRVPVLGQAPASSVVAFNAPQWGDLWRWIALLALAVFCFEWWVYARKS
ncbi:MAG: BatA and WFA domain-containing protein [Armatimonadetes bacterium]|nr:BatA and WFA domain-containing protein [Armatimonadota bacterium]